MRHGANNKPLTEKEKANFENALKRWADLAMSIYADDPRMLSLQEAVVYAKAANRLFRLRTGQTLFTRDGESLDDEGLKDAIVEVVHLMEDKKIAYLDLNNLIGFGINKEGRPFYEDGNLGHCDFEGWIAADWAYKLYHLKDSHAPDGDQILDLIDWISCRNPRKKDKNEE